MKKIVSFLPLIMLFLVFSLGFLVIVKSMQEKDLSQQFEKKILNQEEIHLPKFSFKDLYNSAESITDKDFASQGYKLINLFASWCKTCWSEHDILIDLAKNKDLKIYGFAVMDIDSNTLDYLHKNQNPYFKVGLDKKGDILKLLSAQGLPESYLINNKGQIIYHYQGGLTKDVVKIILNKIN